MTTSPSNHQDGTVGKALQVLDLVASFDRPVRFKEIEDTSPFPKASTYRFVQTLTNQGMLSYHAEEQRYSLGMRLVRLAHNAWKHASLAPIAADDLTKLAEHTGQTVHLAQMDHGQVLYVDKRNALRPVSMFSDAGKVGPAYCTGVGKAILAFLREDVQSRIIAQQSFFAHTPHTLTTAEDLKEELSRIFATGFSFDKEEHELGIICIAMPIFGADQGVLGAISITGSTQRISLDDLLSFKSTLESTTKAIGAKAANWQFPTIK